MELMTAVQTVLRKYVDFSGRANRPEYWWWVLALVIATIVVAIVEGVILAPMLGFEVFASEAGQPLQLLLSLAAFLPSLAVAVRRLHDVDRSGWWYLIVLVPLVVFLVLLYWFVQPGTEGGNQFGPESDLTLS